MQRAEASAACRETIFTRHIMSETNEFISEVTKAAHQLQTLGQDEAHHLILRSITEIRTMRALVGIPANSNHDAVFDLLKIATSATRQTPGDLARALLMAADMMRTLDMVIDSRAAICLTGICQSK
jgi:hypothetical protein